MMPNEFTSIKMRRELLHGGDYNPEQWARVLGVWEEDLRLMGLAGLNSATIGIFSWAALEPREGHFDFDWLDRIFDRLGEQGKKIILATPSGGKPNWLALKYEEVRRCDARGRREPQQGRHNHCWSSPVFREKVMLINTMLAERYGRHPALAYWHISNELGNSPINGSYCYCPLCFAEFRNWLRERYGTVEGMNEAFWARFWSHSYNSFEEVTHIDPSVHALELSWKRFMTDRMTAFIEHEAAPLRKLSPGVPITTNMCGPFPHFDYWEVAKSLDVVSWDNYPLWHAAEGNVEAAVQTAFTHDMYRPMKDGAPWLLMESTPSQTNWQRVSRLKRPGMHRLSSLQAVAHGADAVCYFQFRKSRGSSEKFHGAVVDHVGTEHTRVFREVAALGQDLAALHAVAGSRVPAKAAVVFDWQNWWGIDQSQFPRNADKDYVNTCVAHYRPLWQRGIPTDVVSSVADFSKYRLVVAPMLYMLRPGVAERLEAFVAAGGTLVVTYFSGLVDENDLCFLGGFPGPLRKLLGVWVEETDTLDEGQTQHVLPVAENELRLPARTTATHYCDLVHLESARALATYASDFYAGSPAVTVNAFGKGRAYYVTSRNDAAFTSALVGALAKSAGLSQSDEPLPPGVTHQYREHDGITYHFVMNFGDDEQSVRLDGAAYADALSNEPVAPTVQLPPYSVRVLKSTLS